MFGGDDDILLAGLFDEADPLLGVKLSGVESAANLLFILVPRDDRFALAQTHDLLGRIVRALSMPVSAQFGVEAEVDERAEFGVAEPLAAGIVAATARLPNGIAPGGIGPTGFLSARQGGQPRQGCEDQSR